MNVNWKLRVKHYEIQNLNLNNHILIMSLTGVNFIYKIILQNYKIKELNMKRIFLKNIV